LPQKQRCTILQLRCTILQLSRPPASRSRARATNPFQPRRSKELAPHNSPVFGRRRLKNCREQRGRTIQQAACKPNFVEDDHSSRRRITANAHSDLPAGLAHRAGTRVAAFAATLPAYLVLLRVGFTMPPTLQPKRCALTAPFHPYLIFVGCGGIFSVALAVPKP
jgi:hypothetical protein